LSPFFSDPPELELAVLVELEAPDELAALLADEELLEDPPHAAMPTTAAATAAVRPNE
jgi:hypothetical protein